MATANAYFRDVYRPAFNNEFAQPPLAEGTAFVPFLGGCLDDILCEHFERTVGKDNCVRFHGFTLQIPCDRHRCQYVKAKVCVHRDQDGGLAIFHGPRRLAAYDAQGTYQQPEIKAVA